MDSPGIRRGPHQLGRSVIVEPGAPTPSDWEGCRRVNADRTDDALRRDIATAWATREALIIEATSLPMQRAASVTGRFWTLDPSAAPPNDGLTFHLTANAVDARSPGNWMLLSQAVDAGCTPVHTTEGDVQLPDGTTTWIDGGPLEWVTGVGPILPRLHIECGSLRTLHTPVLPDQTLTVDQSEAVTHQRGPARIIAPAGSGKTRVLTERLRYLVGSGLSTGSITLVAYNVRAQQEMAERLDDVPGVRVSTLHALAFRVLRSIDPTAPRPEVLDEIGVRRLLEPLLPSIRRRADTDGVEPWVDAVNSCRDSLADPADIARRSDQLDGLEHVVLAYREQLRRSGRIDYSEMVLRACEGLLADPNLLNRVRAGVGMLLVDEFQDLTPALMLFVRLLAGPANEVFCVGDDDQTIYGFSGATPRWLVDFDDSFPGARHHALTINHRCPADVVAATDLLLSHNTVRVSKAITAREDAPADGLTVHPPTGAAPELAMTRTIADSIEHGTRPGDIAVLARTNAGLIASYIHLHHAGVPCRPPNGLGTELLHRSGVAALLAWVDLATSRSLDPASLTTALQRPRRKTTPGLTKVIVSKDDLDDLERFVASNSKQEFRDSLVEFCTDIRRARRLVINGANSRQLIAHLLDDTNIASSLDALDSSQRAPRRATHRDQLEAIRSVAELEPRPTHLVPFIVSHLPTSADRKNPDGDRVTLDTVHRVKGLEWPRVHVIGVADGSFPHRLADDIEEERRIFHVAITRCSTSVDIWCGEPESPFVDELTSAQDATTTREPPRSRPRMRSPRSAPTTDNALYQALVEWRTATARSLAKPAYTVFSNAVLASISDIAPTDLRSLAAISGVGPTKLERWGDEVLAIVAEYRNA